MVPELVDTGSIVDEGLVALQYEVSSQTRTSIPNLWHWEVDSLTLSQQASPEMSSVPRASSI